MPGILLASVCGTAAILRTVSLTLPAPSPPHRDHRQGLSARPPPTPPTHTSATSELSAALGLYHQPPSLGSPLFPRLNVLPTGSFENTDLPAAYVHGLLMLFG